MTVGLDRGIKPLLLPPRFGGGLDPVLFVALTATTLVALVAVKLWSAQRLLRVSP